MSEPTMVGTRIRAAREKKGLTQAELARRAKVDLGNLNKLEAGKRKSLSALNLAAVAKVLDVTQEYLLGLTSRRT